MADRRDRDGSEGAAPMSRRSMLGRVGKGAVVAGLAAWTAPEILVATPAGASGLSSEPTWPGGGSGGGASGDTGGVDGNSGGTSAGSASAVGGSLPEVTTASGSSGGGAPLAFTGADAEAMLAAGAALVSGGWVISRWASRRGDAAAPEGTSSPPS